MKTNKQNPMVIKVSHVPALISAIGWDRDAFLREAYYREGMSRNTALKALAGDTDLSIQTVEACMRLFRKDFCEVMEVRIS